MLRLLLFYKKITVILTQFCKNFGFFMDVYIFIILLLSIIHKKNNNIACVVNKLCFSYVEIFYFVLNSLYLNEEICKLMKRSLLLC